MDTLNQSILPDSFSWYPPAETRLPLMAMIKAFLPGPSNFEKALCRYLGMRAAVSASSGRCLLSVLLSLLKLRAGGRQCEVLIPGYTCYSVAASIARAGLKLRVYDLDPATLDPDMDSFRGAFRESTLAVVVQHLFGIPSRIDEIVDLAKAAHVALIEDAAQGLGGMSGEKYLGTRGDYGLFSFGRGKPLPLGTGGALVSQDEETLSQLQTGDQGNGYAVPVVALATRVLSDRRLYGIVESLPLGLGETRFDPGFAVSTMVKTARKMGCAALDYVNTLNMHRTTVAHVYTSDLPASRLFPVSGTDKPVFARFPFRARMTALSKDLKRSGIRKMYPRAISDEPEIRKYFAQEAMHTPGSREIAEIMVTLPTHLGISPVHAEAICKKIQEEHI